MLNFFFHFNNVALNSNVFAVPVDVKILFDYLTRSQLVFYARGCTAIR